jgi:hypothetical protein
VSDIRRLGSILDAIKPYLPDDVVYRIGGREEVARQDPARRIVMQPWQRAYEAPHKTGGPGGALFTRVETVRMHIWGKNLDEVEELEELLVNAIVRVATWTVRPGTGTWALKANADRGFVAVQDMSFLIPIIRRVVSVPLQPGVITGEIESSV